MTTQQEIAEILAHWGERDEDALNKLTPLIFEELRRLAHYYFRHEAPGHTLQPTAVVNEVYLRLVGSRLEQIKSRERFFAVASRLIREILVDHARARQARKRGGGVPKLRIEEGLGVPLRQSLEPATLLAVHEALGRLEQLDPRQCRIVELRYFAGLTLPEIATVLEVSLATVERAGSIANRWLARELRTRR